MKYRIEHDDWQGESPREWDNLGTMVCAHRRYNLGDEQLNDLGCWLSGMLDELGIENTDNQGYYTQYWEDFIHDLEFNDDDAIRRAFELLDKHIFRLPLYLYDHSGITMSASPFSCPWDSGQVGFIYVTKADVRKEWNKQRISKQLAQKVIDCLKSEVKTYDQYLTGDVWGYVIEDRHGEHVDSCWGFYGYEYCEEEAKEQMSYFQEEEDKELIELQSQVRQLVTSSA